MKKALTTDLSVSAGRNYRPADPEIGGGGVKGTHRRWETEILALGPKTSLEKGAHMVFSAGGGPRI